MSVRIGCGLSTSGDPRVAAIEAGTDARQGLDGRPADLVVVFCSGGHLAAPEATLEGVHEALAPGALIGCGAGGVLAAGRELEGGTAVTVWAASLGAGRAEAFHAHATPGAGGAVALSGMPAAARRVGRDPAARPLLVPGRSRARRPRGSPRRGRRCSAASRAPARWTAGRRSSSATPSSARAPSACVLRGVEVLPCVSQGAARDRAGAGDHGGRGPCHPRAGRAAGARGAARGDRGAARGRARPRQRRPPARRRRRRPARARRRARLPRARDHRRGSRRRDGRPSAPR